MQDFEKRKTLRRLWLERPIERRTENDMLVFHEWISENFPTLLKRSGTITFEEFRADLLPLQESQERSA
jgi:hypothetical protein